jgi:hypothetical protein
MLENCVFPNIAAEADGPSSNKMVHQPNKMAPLYALLWKNGFLIDGSVGEATES